MRFVAVEIAFWAVPTFTVRIGCLSLYLQRQQTFHRQHSEHLLEQLAQRFALSGPEIR
jgi:hypothetical protein